MAAGEFAHLKQQRRARSCRGGNMAWKAAATMSLVVIMLMASVGAAPTEELLSTLEDQREVGVTIYNENLALVKDRRQITMSRGENSLAMREVSGRIRPETALLRSISHPGAVTLIEQNFDFDLLTPQKLVEKYVGREVGVVRTHPTTGVETVVQATVLSTNNGVVLRLGDRIETGVPGRMVFPEVPDNLRDRPTLVVRLASAVDNDQLIELSYLTGGLSWKADYVAELNDNDDRLDINGWVTLTNTSGTTYKNAGLQLVAGDVHQAPRAERMFRSKMAMDTVMEAQGAPMAEESLLDFHLYSLPRPTTIKDNQTKQVALLQATGVRCAKEYLLVGQQYYYQGRYGQIGDRIKVGVFLNFDNRKEDNLGMPLPKGVVRVYKKDSSDNLQFVGEDRVDHTPENETVKLKLGDAFDVTARRKQTDFKKIAGFSGYNYVYETAFEIELKNGRDEAVDVMVLEPMPGDWEMISSSHKFTRESSSAASWNVAVPAKGEATLSYRVRVRY